jgi:hypothetical protein
MKNGVYSLHAFVNLTAMCDVDAVRRERGLQDVYADNVVGRIPQHADQRLTEMPGTAGD